MPTKPCPGCSALLPEIDGPVHEYMESSPACWAAYCQVLEREYSTPELLAVHRLSVDSYAVQHPGGSSRQAVQSVGFHLVRLYFFLEQGLPAKHAHAAMLRVSKTKANMFRLDRPASLGDLTAADVLAAEGVSAHAEAVRRWAASAWHAWGEHHSTVRQWASAA